MRALLIITMMLSLMACSTQLQAEKPAVLEALYGIDINKNSIEIKVRSFGCTKAKHFSIENSENGLSINRIKRDYCKKMPSVVLISLPFEKQESSYRVLNPFR